MSVERYLAEALASLVASIDLADDDDMDPDVATTILEPVGVLLGGMNEVQREEFAELMRICAAAEANSDRRQAILEIPEAFGLVGDS